MSQIEVLSIYDIMKMMGVGRKTAEQYARESGALLPRTKGATYRVRKEKFITWAKGEKNEH